MNSKDEFIELLIDGGFQNGDKRTRMIELIGQLVGNGDPLPPDIGLMLDELIASFFPGCPPIKTFAQAARAIWGFLQT